LAALLWLLVAYGARSFATDAGFGEPVRTWLDAIVLPAILFVACERYCLRGANRGRNLACALMIAGAALGAIGLAQRIFGFELATLTGGSVRFDAAVDTTRVSGPYPAPEPYALSLIVCLGATFYWILSRPRGKGYGWAIVLMGLQVTGIALALFRAGWIAAALVAIASLGYRPGRFGRAFAVTLIAAAIGIAATTQLEHSKTVATRVNNTDNIWGRLATYEQGVTIFRRHPIFGIGVDRYHDVATALPPVVLHRVASVTYPHSSYVGLLAEQGLLGFLPLLVLSVGIWRLTAALRLASFRSREALLLLGPVAGVALGCLIMSLTLTMLPYEPSNAFFAVLLGIAAGRLDALAADQRAKTASG
jgi:O-antigen ligase